jgi:FKBP-type peptidyl-prolyl cis-trans isomerase FklB
MKRGWVLFVGLCLLAPSARAGEPSALKTEKEQMSYGVGVDMARHFKRSGVEIDVDTLIRALKDELSGSPLLLSEAELRAARTAYQAAIRRNLAEARGAAGSENKKKSDAFLAENKAKPGVVTLPSGLQYTILQAGTGRKPADTDTVECHYRGTLLDGTEFDSSYKAGHPRTFKVAGVIPGFREALKLMPAGSKWRIVIPPQLAYGSRGSGKTIPPQAALIYEVELLGVK